MFMVENKTLNKELKNNKKRGSKGFVSTKLWQFLDWITLSDCN
jgi:hypothetical protein